MRSSPTASSRCCAASSPVSGSPRSRRRCTSVKTISTHKSRIQEKLNLPTLADLVRYGLEHDLDAGGSVQVP